MTGLDLVGWPADRTVSLSGSASGLKLPLALRNAGRGMLHVAEASLSEVHRTGGGPPLRLDPVPIGMNLAGEAVTRTQLRLRLDPATPPGRYEGVVRLGDLTRPVTIDVLPEARLAIRPDPLVIDASDGLTHEISVSVENRGNIDLTIDLTGAYPVGEEAPVASAPARDGADRLAVLFDRMSGRGTAPSLLPFGSADLRQSGGAERVEPGGARIVAAEISLPEGLSPTARYHLFAPLYTADLHIVIVTAAKTMAPPRTPRRIKGAAA